MMRTDLDRKNQARSLRPRGLRDGGDGSGGKIIARIIVIKAGAGRICANWNVRGDRGREEVEKNKPTLALTYSWSLWESLAAALTTIQTILF